MTVFGYAITFSVLALWFWWLERRNNASVKQLAAAAKAEADEDDDEEDDRFNERRRRLLKAARFPLHGLAVVFRAAAVVFLVLSFFRTVPTGTAAVPVTFGRASRQVGPGLHLEWPITRMRNISVRTQSYTMATNGDDPSVQVLGQDGTVATADATLLYRVSRSQATNIYENVGTTYNATIVRPTARTCVRAGFTKKPMIEAATVDFSNVETDIADCIKQKLHANGIGVLDFQLRELRLSTQLQNAIDGQIAAKMLGVTGPLDPKYLQFYYIQTLQKFASSSNNSLVITGGGPTPTLAVPTPGGSSTATTTTTTNPGP